MTSTCTHRLAPIDVKHFIQKGKRHNTAGKYIILKLDKLLNGIFQRFYRNKRGFANFGRKNRVVIYIKELFSPFKFPLHQAVHKHKKVTENLLKLVYITPEAF